MSDFDIDKFDSYVEEAQKSADETRPAPEPEPILEPVMEHAPRVKAEPDGEPWEMVANRPGRQDTQFNNDVEEDFEPRFRKDMASAIRKAFKEEWTRKLHIKHLQQKLGFER